jgi:FtsZ-binding cell division protein ZapB
MARVLAIALFLLAGCDQAKQQPATTDLEWRSGQQAAEIEQLKDEVNSLKQEQTQASAAEDDTQAQLDSLRNTVNNNVEIDNRRAKGTFELIQGVDDRLSRYDGLHTTR